jgi:hypothetical protein
MIMTAPALRLYEAVDALETVRTWIDEHAEEIIAAGGELPAELSELLDQAEGQLADKIERVALYIRELLATAEAIRVERDRLEARARHAERAAEGLKRYLQAQLERAGLTRVVGELVTVRLQKSPPRVVSTLDEEALRRSEGAEWVTVIPAQYRIDPRKLLDYYKQGLPLPDGITVEQGQHVRIS